MCLYDHYKGLQIIGGDFNEILHSREKFGGRPINNTCLNQFTDCTNYCNLVDLGYKGSKYTWTNERHYVDHILERLDRLFANYDWLTLFPESTIRYLNRTHSDHTQLLLTLHTPKIAKSHTFRFETIWTSHTDFINVLRDSWHPSPSPLPEAINHFQNNVQFWNRPFFGNIFHKK